MQNATLDLPMEVVSEDGHTYVIAPFEATHEKLDFLWDQAKAHDFLFSSDTRGRRDLFDSYLLSPGVVVLEVYELNTETENPDDAVKYVGILYADRLTPRASARGHYLFWDHNQKGRHRVILSGLRWAMEAFDLHRIDIEVPRYAFAALRRIHKLGLRLEGEKREAVMSRKNKWQDVLLFGIVREEITDEVIEDGHLKRGKEEARWFGILDNPSAILTKAVLREGR